MYVPSPLEIYSIGGYWSDCAFEDETFSEQNGRSVL